MASNDDSQSSLPSATNPSSADHLPNGINGINVNGVNDSRVISTPDLINNATASNEPHFRIYFPGERSNDHLLAAVDMLELANAHSRGCLLTSREAIALGDWFRAINPNRLLSRLPIHLSDADETETTHV